MPNHHETHDSPTSPQDVGLSPTPTDGLSEGAAIANELGISGNDPNANAMNANAEKVANRQAGYEIDDRSAGNIEPPESPAFQDGT